jgi:hypothetical protein
MKAPLQRRAPSRGSAVLTPTGQHYKAGLSGPEPPDGVGGSAHQLA